MYRAIENVVLSIVISAATMLAADGNAVAQPASTPTPDPIVAEMQRCNALGLKAEQDERCQAAYKANRDRFFGTGSSTYTPIPIDPFPGVPKAPEPKSKGPQSVQDQN
ncbi:MAG TPA: putative entry exclusion protein TrbK-alt [Alphaproteobacteria bacterium]|nr:putative entry exclusion protein TrbK-alt [Alphaproteobacteria bacterium]